MAFYLIRRPVVLCMILGVSIWLVNVSRTWRGGQTGLDDPVRFEKFPGGNSGLGDTSSTAEKEIRTVTVTSTLRTTHTVKSIIPAKTDSAFTNARDVFGFPIINTTVPSINLLLPPPSEKLSDWDSAESTSSHHYRGDGLLEVSPTGPHPIFELMKRAEGLWDHKHRKASTNLKNAYMEYQRRYGRRPPKGFEAWWSYAMSHSVALPDEYDQINRDLEPFWGMDPTFLRRVQRDWEAHPDSFTVGKEEGGKHITALNFSETEDLRVRQLMEDGITMISESLKDVEEHLGPFRAVFSPHDNPNLPSDYNLRIDAMQAAKEGRYIDFKTRPNAKLYGWKTACDPLSPAWVSAIPYTANLPPLAEIFQLKYTSPHARSNAAARKPKTFIHNHRESMDPCLHPAHLLSHGEFLAYKDGPPWPQRRLVPQFSYSPTTLHDDITFAASINWVDDIYPREDDPPFKAKADSRLNWRGRNTGVWHGRDRDVAWSEEKRARKNSVKSGEDAHKQAGTWWWFGQRGRLVEWGSSVVNHGLSKSDDKRGQKGSGERVLRSTPNVLWAVGDGSEEIVKAAWAPAMVDIAYAGTPIACGGKMCEKLKEVYEFRRLHDAKMQGQYKFVIDVDGNGWSSRFKRLITSNALIFKSTIYPEWFIDRIAPWVHHIPVQVDLTDLLDSLYFFRGDPSGYNAHLDLAEKIARQGREWSRNYWRKADMTAYNFRLFLEYARVMSVDRDEYVVVDAVADAEILGSGAAVKFGHAKGNGRGTVKLKVKKQDYVYRMEDEWVPEEKAKGVGVEKEGRKWDWKFRQRKMAGAKKKAEKLTDQSGQ